MRKGISLLLIAAAYALSAAVYTDLPARVALEWSALIPWIPTADAETLPRAAAAFGLPTVALLVWGLLHAVASEAGERLGKRVFPRWLLSDRTGSAGVARFDPTFDAIVAILVALLLLLHAVLLGSALGWPAWTFRAFAASVGAGIFALGNIMPRTRPNWVAGVRTRRTLSDPDLWRRTHRYLGALLMVTGVIVIVTSFFTAPYAILVAVIGGLGSAIAASAFAARGHRSSPGSLPAVAAVVLALGAPGILGAQTGDESSAFVEEPFEVTSGDLVLPGTITLPSPSPASLPVAVIIAGSGPTDRDGNGPLVQTDLYAQLARGLALRGVASVRYDKRAIGPAATKLDHAALTLDHFVDDVAAAARALAAEPEYSAVFLVGHSEGAGLALQAANRGAPVAGVAMLAGQGRPLQELLHDQFSVVADSLTVARSDDAFARYLRGEDVADAPEIARPVLVPFYRRLMASMAAYDPEAEIQRAAVPVLVVQGGMDLQVGDADAERLRAARPDAAFLRIPDANHVFKATSSRDPAVQQALYMDRALPIVPGLVEAVADWIAAAGDAMAGQAVSESGRM